MAAYLDAGSAVRIDPNLEKEVTFSFALRKSPDQKSSPICRKEVGPPPPPPPPGPIVGRWVAHRGLCTTAIHGT